MQTIEIDCAPGMPRPDEHLPGILKDTCLEAYSHKEPISKFFGNWMWDFSEINPECWESCKPLIKERIIKLYNNGWIRYGSW